MKLLSTIIIFLSSNKDIISASSNISFSALTSGIEWNYRLVKSVDKENFNIFLDTINDLFDKL